MSFIFQVKTVPSVILYALNAVGPQGSPVEINLNEFNYLQSFHYDFFIGIL